MFISVLSEGEMKLKYELFCQKRPTSSSESESDSFSFSFSFSFMTGAGGAGAGVDAARSFLFLFGVGTRTCRGDGLLAAALALFARPERVVTMMLCRD